MEFARIKVTVSLHTVLVLFTIMLAVFELTCVMLTDPGSDQAFRLENQETTWATVFHTLLCSLSLAISLFYSTHVIAFVREQRAVRSATGENKRTLMNFIDDWAEEEKKVLRYLGMLTSVLICAGNVVITQLFTGHRHVHVSSTQVMAQVGEGAMNATDIMMGSENSLISLTRDVFNTTFMRFIFNSTTFMQFCIYFQFTIWLASLVGAGWLAGRLSLIMEMRRKGTSPRVD